MGLVVDGLPIRGVGMREQVLCECGDEACGCDAACTALACYEWGSVDVGNWQYLCLRCASRLVERGTAPDGQTAEKGD